MFSRNVMIAGHLALGVALPLTEAGAHEIASDVTLQLLVRPQAERLQLLVRAPMEAMQDIPFPTTERGLLDLADARLNRVLADAAALWIGENLELSESGRRLPELEIVAVRVSLPSDRSFESYEAALRHVTGEPLADSTQIAWRQAMVDALFEAPIHSERSEFAIRPSHGRLGLRVVTVLRYLPPGGGVRAFELRGEPGWVRLDPSWHQAAGRFAALGFFHILEGLDHLLFLLCLVVPLRRLRQLIPVVTSFTVAHSMTLIAAALGLVPNALWFPPLVELVIAASIVYMALENILGVRVEKRWLVTFAFGLVHGFGFSFALHESLQFAGSHLLTSLLSFNLGVEIGQLAVLLVLVPLLEWLLHRAVPEKTGTVLLSALVAHSAWHWMSERWATLSEYAPDPFWLRPASKAGLLGVVLLIILACLALRRLGRAPTSSRQKPALAPKQEGAGGSGAQP